MLCYRDTTFCPFEDCRDWNTCPSALTENIRQGAEDMNMMIAQFAMQPFCFVEEE